MEEISPYDHFCLLLHRLSGGGCPLCGRDAGGCWPDLLCRPCHRELADQFLGVRMYFSGFPVTALFEYRGAARQLMQAAKFDHCRVSALALAAAGGELYARPVGNSFQAVLPMPCSRRSQIDRGWDPAALFCRFLGVGQLPGRLLLRRNSKQQKRLRREERIASGVGLIRASKSVLASDVLMSGEGAVALVDDVMTTGTTLTQAMNALVEIGVPAATLQGLVLCCD